MRRISLADGLIFVLFDDSGVDIKLLSYEQSWFHPLWYKTSPCPYQSVPFRPLPYIMPERNDLTPTNRKPYSLH
jgi:hypothetical protein